MSFNESTLFVKPELIQYFHSPSRHKSPIPPQCTNDQEYSRSRISYALSPFTTQASINISKSSSHHQRNTTQSSFFNQSNKNYFNKTQQEEVYAQRISKSDVNHLTTNVKDLLKKSNTVQEQSPSKQNAQILIKECNILKRKYQDECDRSIQLQEQVDQRIKEQITLKSRYQDECLKILNQQVQLADMNTQLCSLRDSYETKISNLQCQVDSTTKQLKTSEQQYINRILNLEIQLQEVKQIHQSSNQLQLLEVQVKDLKSENIQLKDFAEKIGKAEQSVLRYRKKTTELSIALEQMNQLLTTREQREKALTHELQISNQERVKLGVKMKQLEFLNQIGDQKNQQIPILTQQLREYELKQEKVEKSLTEQNLNLKCEIAEYEFQKEKFINQTIKSTHQEKRQTYLNPQCNRCGYRELKFCDDVDVQFNDDKQFSFESP